MKRAASPPPPKSSSLSNHLPPHHDAASTSSSSSSSTVTTTPTPTSSSSSSAGGFTLLPEGTDVLLAEFLGGSQGLGCLACAHRDLHHFPAFVERLERLTTARADSLVMWLVSRETSQRHLPRLRHISVDYSMRENDLVGFLERTDAFPLLESVDLSEHSTFDIFLELILRALASVRLHAFIFPGFYSNRDKYWPPSIENALSRLEHLREVGCRSPRVRDIGGAFTATLNTKERFLSWGKHLQILDFASFSGSNRAGPSDHAHEQTPVSPAFPQLRVLRVEGPLLSYLYTRQSMYAMMRMIGDGAICGLNQLSLDVSASQGEAVPDVVGFLARGLREGPIAAVSKLRVLRLRGFAIGGFDAAVRLVDLFSGDRANDGRWDGLQVLDLTNCLLGDIGLERLAEAMAGGCFGAGLEELDFTLTRQEGRNPQSTFGPAGLRAVVQALNARGEGVRLKRLRLGGQHVGDGGVDELVAGWADGTCFDGLTELKLNDNRLTDESVGALVASGMLCRPATPQPQQQGHTKKQPVLQRLVLDGNMIRGGSQLRAQFAQLLASTGASSWSSSLVRLNLKRNPLGAVGLGALLACSGSGLQELNVGGNEGPMADNDPLAHAIIFVAASPMNKSALLAELRHLDMGRLVVSRAFVGELMERLHIFPRLCGLQLRVNDLTRAEKEELLRALKEARLPCTWDVLEVNKLRAFRRW